jgi:hypothetical protein
MIERLLGNRVLSRGALANTDFPNDGWFRIDHNDKTTLTTLTMDLYLQASHFIGQHNVHKINDNDRDGKGREGIQSDLGATHR